MTAAVLDIARRLKAASRISSDDTLTMRREVWADGRIDPAEAEAIFDLNTVVKSTAREWVDFFVEAMKHYVVHQQVPEGFVDDAKAQWLIERIDSDGRVDSLGEIELLVEILEDATNAPDRLKAYALEQIRTAVLTGYGPTRQGDALDAGSINRTEVALLRRLLYAAASDGPAAVSRAEADMLFEIKDATLGAANATEWQSFFVQAIGNHLLTHSDYQPIRSSDQGRLDAFMDDNHVHLGRFLGKMAESGPLDAVAKSGFAWSDLLTPWRARHSSTPIRAVVSEDLVVTPAEGAWLKSRINADGALDPIEQALLAFLSSESGQHVSD